MSGPVESTIPALPCASLPDTLPFYELMGFRVTYQQKAPNGYAVVCRGALQLHLFQLRGLKPENAFSMCLIVVPDVAPYHHEFSASLRRHYGKLMVSGFPRITRMKPGQSRFTLTDPAGNGLIFVTRTAADTRSAPESPDPPARSRLAAALATAAKLRDHASDDERAAKVLDAALASMTDAPADAADAIDRARVLAARAEVAVALGDLPLARRLQQALRDLPLSAEARTSLRPELDAADELLRSLAMET